jgi:GDP-L-fucose synthase
LDKNQKIFVSGHQGMVGSSILQLLKENGYFNIVTALRQMLDLRDQAACQFFFENHSPDIVIHAAGTVGGIAANSQNKATFIYDNIMIATNVIHAAHLTGVKKLINLGSSCIYPKEAPQPIRESDLLTGKLEPTNEAYALAKIAAVKMCQYYHEQYGCNFYSLMPCNLYGPNDRFDLEKAHVLPMFVRKFHLAKLLSEKNYPAITQDFARFGNSLSSAKNSSMPSIKEIHTHLAGFGIESAETGVSLTLWGSGTPKREFLHVDDLARAVLLLMENCNTEDVEGLINVGSGTDIQLMDLAKLVQGIVGNRTTVHWDRQHPDGTMRKCLEVSKISKLSWQPRITLAEGIASVYRWYLKESGKKAIV